MQVETVYLKVTNALNGEEVFINPRYIVLIHEYGDNMSEIVMATETNIIAEGSPDKLV